MKELTQEQAERAARVCGYRCEERYWYAPDQVIGDKPLWDDANQTFAPSLDPMYWFSRLWERLDSIRPNANWIRMAKICAEMHDNKGMIERYYAYRIEVYHIEDGIIVPWSEHPCLALCAAIEALAGQDKSADSAGEGE